MSGVTVDALAMATVHYLDIEMTPIQLMMEKGSRLAIVSVNSTYFK